MKMRSVFAFMFAALLPAMALAEVYTVSVTRIDQDLYKTGGSTLYIETRYCYEYAIGAMAVLKYGQYSYDNKLIFDSGTECDVVKVFR
jgi:hypothetical protein